jgi:S1-C subfamily serine protease
MRLLAVRPWLAALAVLPLIAQAQIPLWFHARAQTGFRQIPTRSGNSYRQILPSIVTLQSNGQPTGCAALIDGTGLFIAHRDSVIGSEVEGKFWNGATSHLHVLSQDGCTQLVLLRSDYIPPEARAVVAPPRETDPGTALIVIMNSGSVRARIETTSLMGIVRPFQRLLPLSEIRLETPLGTLGGALVFTETGYFVGVLNATLSREQVTPVPAIAAFAAGRAMYRNLESRSGGGPADLTVAYTPGVDVIRKVLDGFISPTHEVEHPSIGIYCRDGVQGALVTAIQPDSPAEKAGVKPGDLIIGIDLFLIRNQLDFAKVMFREHPNNKMLLRIDRGDRQLMKTVVVGETTD